MKKFSFLQILFWKMYPTIKIINICCLNVSSMVRLKLGAAAHTLTALKHFLNRTLFSNVYCTHSPASVLLPGRFLLHAKAYVAPFVWCGGNALQSLFQACRKVATCGGRIDTLLWILDVGAIICFLLWAWCKRNPISNTKYSWFS